MNIFDISPLVSSSLAVFPGDQKFHRQIAMSFEKNDNLELSSILTTLHIGAHADAPSHYSPHGESIEARDLGLYMGRCQVLTATGSRNGRIYPEHLSQTPEAKRILIRTKSFPNPEQWNSNFLALSPELIHELKQKNVCLVGIDTPSVDPADDKILETHQEIFRANIAVLEGLVLDRVYDGHYVLIAMPLRLKEAEASPVRAVLLPIGEVHLLEKSFR